MSCKPRGGAQCGGQLGARLFRGVKDRALGLAVVAIGLAGVWVWRGSGTEGLVRVV
jgi:hypothetical protein